MRLDGPQGPSAGMPTGGSSGTGIGDGGGFSALTERLGKETASGRSETRFYLELQKEIQAESRYFQTVSNILKARHDSAMAAIRNLK
ncbi:MAG: hypothetical protein AAGN66_01085 [Acidobacteriota bacterium]